MLPGPELWHYIPHLLLMNVLHPETSSSVVPGGWSISLEVIFYMAIPLLYLYVNTLRRSLLFVAVTCLILPLVNYALSKSIGTWINTDDSILNMLFWYRTPLNQIGAFAFGFLLFYMSKSGVSGWLSGHRHCALVLFGLCLLMCFILPIAPYISKFRHLIFAGTFCVMTLVLSEFPFRLLVNRWFRFLGKISFSFYLFHFFILKELLELYQSWGSEISDPMARFVAFFVVGMLLTIPVACLSYRLIETPAISAGRKLIKWREHRDSVSVTSAI